MRIIPVIDLKGSVVVRGIGGRRDEYRPIISRLVNSAAPDEVAATFHRLGYKMVYVADLDAIAGAPPAWNTYAEMLDTGVQLWLDAGLRNLPQAEELARFQHNGLNISGLIAGMETLPSELLLRDLLAIWGPERIIVSLDLKHGQPLTACPQWQAASPLNIARELIQLGIQHLIVLDLARVGEGRGPGTKTLCQEIRTLSPTLNLIAGGGIRHPQDLQTLAQSGCTAALVASALHDGRLE